MIATIYALRDPRTSAVRYVGMTRTRLSQRLYSHIYEARKGVKTHKNAWIRSLLKLSLTPIIEAIEVTNSWEEREIYWIAFYRSQGADLTNLAEGGRGANGWHHSAETRARMSIVRKGRKQPPRSTEHKAKISAALKGRKTTESQKRAISERLKGKRQTDEHNKKKSAALKGRRPSDLCLQRSKEASTGRKPSEATRQKMSQSHKGARYTKERNEKVAAAVTERWRKWREEHGIQR